MDPRANTGLTCSLDPPPSDPKGEVDPVGGVSTCHHIWD